MTMQAPQNRKFDKLSEIDHESQSYIDSEYGSKCHTGQNWLAWRNMWTVRECPQSRKFVCLARIRPEKKFVFPRETNNI